MLSVSGGSAQQITISSLCNDTVAPISAVEHLLLQAHQSGTHYQTISVIHRVAKTLLGDN